MTSPSTPSNPSTNDDNTASTSRSYSQPTVHLSDWWLIKVEKHFRRNRLAVAGIPHRDGGRALRVFSSAPILKRHDLFNLETADGVWIIIKGLINKARTVENGFPSEVFDHFLVGFPPQWEDYALDCFEGEYPTMGAAESNSYPENFSPEAGIVDFIDSPIINHKNVSSEEAEDGSNPENFFPEAGIELPVKADFISSPIINHRNVGSERAEDGNCKMNSSIEVCPAGGREESGSTSFGECSHNDRCCSDEPGLSLVVPEASAVEPSSGNCLIEHVGTNKLNRKRAGKVMHSPSALGSVQKKGQKNAGAGKQPISQPANFSTKKGSSATPKKKEESFIASPESLSLKRSRSGRLLLPTMQFWRNQRAVYDADRRIMGITDPLNQLTKGSGSEPQRKKRPLW